MKAVNVSDLKYYDVSWSACFTDSYGSSNFTASSDENESAILFGLYLIFRIYNSFNVAKSFLV